MAPAASDVAPAVAMAILLRALGLSPSDKDGRSNPEVLPTFDHERAPRYPLETDPVFVAITMNSTERYRSDPFEFGINIFDTKQLTVLSPGVDGEQWISRIPNSTVLVIAGRHHHPRTAYLAAAHADMELVEADLASLRVRLRNLGCDGSRNIIVIGDNLQKQRMSLGDQIGDVLGENKHIIHAFDTLDLARSLFLTGENQDLTAKLSFPWNLRTLCGLLEIPTSNMYNVGCRAMYNMQVMLVMVLRFAEARAHIWRHRKGEHRQGDSRPEASKQDMTGRGLTTIRSDERRGGATVQEQAATEGQLSDEIAQPTDAKSEVVTASRTARKTSSAPSQPIESSIQSQLKVLSASASTQSVKGASQSLGPTDIIKHIASSAEPSLVSTPVKTQPSKPSKPTKPTTSSSAAGGIQQKPSTSGIWDRSDFVEDHDGRLVIITDTDIERLPERIARRVERYKAETSTLVSDMTTAVMDAGYGEYSKEAVARMIKDLDCLARLYCREKAPSEEARARLRLIIDLRTFVSDWYSNISGVPRKVVQKTARHRAFNSTLEAILAFFDGGGK